MVRGVWVVMGVVGLDRRWFKAIVGKSVGQSVGRSDGPGPSRVSSIRVVGPFTAPPFCIQATSAPAPRPAVRPSARPPVSRYVSPSVRPSVSQAFRPSFY